jgi:hypothetical protein
MTSEVVVMNSLGVALATDSATTVTVGRDNKVYNSADKLFMLSKRHPVGVMVYNNASLLGIPWETLLKMFRRHLGADEFSNLEEYGHKLISFLDFNTALFPKAAEYKYYLRLVGTLYRGINKGIERQILNEIRKGIDDPNREKIAAAYIRASHQEWMTESDAERLDPNAGTELASQGSREVQELIERSFPSLKLGHDVITELRQLATLVVSKRKILEDIRSGVVIAGFGRDEYFPVMQHFEIGEVYGGRLKYYQSPTEKIDREKTLSIIKPFAHSDMVETFLGGISPSLKTRVIQEFVTLVTELPDAMIDSITDLSKPKREHWKTIMRAYSEDAAGDLVKKLEQYRLNRHLAPVRA